MTTTTLTGAARADGTGRTERRLPALGGFGATVLALELRRVSRNRRTVIFSLVMPVLFFFLFGNGQSQAAARAYVLVSLAVYGAMTATTAGGAAVSVERASGWCRRLRLTPMRPAAYIATKVVVAMTLALASVVVTLAAGIAAGVSIPASTLVLCGLAAWLGSVVFAAFGLFMGYLLPSENVMQILGPLLGGLAFLGGIFVPVSQFGSTLASIARLTPVYGVSEIARSPLTSDGITVAAIANIAIWTVVFATGAAWRFRRDTTRG